MAVLTGPVRGEIPDEWTASLLVAQEGQDYIAPHIGMADDASGAYDPATDYYAPPTGPDEARVGLCGSEPDDPWLSDDIRAPSEKETWRLRIDVPQGQAWTCRWTPADLPGAGPLRWREADAEWNGVGDWHDMRVEDHIAVAGEPAGAVSRRYLVRFGPIEYALNVRSVPVTGVSVAGTPTECGGSTDYDVDLDENTSVALVAPETREDGQDAYRFVKWTLDGAPQAEGERALALTMTGPRLAVAEYALDSPGRKGDFDRDGDVDFLDFMVFIDVYGLTDADPAWDDLCPIGDFDDDGDVDFWDFMAFVDVYGT